MATNKATLDDLAKDGSSYIDLFLSVRLTNRYLNEAQRRAITALVHEQGRMMQAALGLVCPNRSTIAMTAVTTHDGSHFLSLLNEVTDDTVDNEH